MLFYTAVKGLDFYSTIIQGSYTAEENPLVRYVWQYGGVLGFVLLTVVFLLIVNGGVYLLVRRYKTQWFSLVLWIGGFATLSIVLVNLVWIPYEYSLWIDYVYKFIGV